MSPNTPPPQQPLTAPSSQSSSLIDPKNPSADLPDLSIIPMINNYTSPTTPNLPVHRALSPEERADLLSLYKTPPEPYKWTLGDELKKFAKKELREDEKSREQALAQMRNWILKTDFIKNCRIDSNFLLRFLRVKKFSVPMAQETLLKYVAMRQQNPHWFHDTTIEDPMVEDLIDRGVAFALPGKDKAGRRVMFTIGAGIDPNYHTAESVMKAIMLTFESFLEDEETQIRGFSHVLDESGIQMSHLVLWNPAEIARIFGICEKAMPMRHKRLDFVRLPTILNYVFDFVMNFISDKLRSRVFIHKTQLNLQDGIDVKILPKEYGGTIPVSEMTQMFKAEIRARNHRVHALDRMTLDLDLMKKAAQAEQNNGATAGKCGHQGLINMGLAGSFKKLEID